MTSDSCQRYLEDPENNAAHLAECEDCRALAETLEDGVNETARVDVNALPIAGWESAAYRPWPLVAAGAIALAVIAGLLFAATGTSPADLLRGRMPSGDLVASMLRLAGGAVQNAPAFLQILLVIAFVVVNAILFALLRRAPRGIDV